MILEDLPSSIRAKISENDRERLWSEIGNIKEFGDQKNYPVSKLYNWKNHAEFLPIELIRDVLEEPTITALKGQSRSKPLENPNLPFQPNDELLTRIEASVSVNYEGVPIYQTDDRWLASRFVGLLSRYGDVPFSVYNRSVFEVRYPKYMQRVFSEMDHDEDFAAMVDEKGRVEHGKVKYGEKSVPAEEFEGSLYSRSKRISLALARNEPKEVTRIIQKESTEVREALNLD